MSEVLAEVWRRATSVQPVPDPAAVALTGLLALALVAMPGTWPHVRLVVTLVHEAGHALVAVLVGRRLQGIRLHSDTSGVTVSRGRRRGPGMVLMLLAGYLAPGVLGLCAALMLAHGRSLGLLWLAVLLFAAMILHVRNLFGLAVLGFAGLGTLAVSWYADPVIQSLVAHQLVWILLLAGPRPVIELVRARWRGARSSDADQLARLTRVPAAVWILVFGLGNLAGLVVGASTLLPALR